MKTPQQIKFVVEWPQELAAGLYGGSEEITVTLETGGWDKSFMTDFQEALRLTIAEQFDLPRVYTLEEYERQCQEQEPPVELIEPEDLKG